MTDLLTLADRVQALTSACREMDLAISVAINFKGVFAGDREYKWSVMADEIEGHKAGKKSFLDPFQFVPRWTASLDAAMTLVPEGWDYCLSVGVGEPAQVGMSPAGGVAEVEADAATPALALTAASLRARAALEYSHG